MRDEVKVIGDCAVTRLEKLLAEIEADTHQVVGEGDLPTTVTHYAGVRALWESLKKRVNALEAHVESLSYETLPTMFENQGVKTISLPDVGRVTVNVRWTASMVDGAKEKAIDWMRQTGNGGLVIETISASTLRSFAREETIAGRPLPDDLFKIGTARHMSITKE